MKTKPKPAKQLLLPVMAALPPDEDRLDQDYIYVLRLSSGTGVWVRFRETKRHCWVMWWNKPSQQDLTEMQELKPWLKDLGVSIKPDELQDTIDQLIEPKNS